MISKSFLKSSLIYTIGGALPMLASILLLPFYLNYLSEKQYVSLSFYIGISLLLQILFSYSVETYFGVKYTQLNESPAEQKRFVGTISIFSLLIGIGLILVSLLVFPFLFPHVFSEKDQVTFWPYGLASVITAFFNAYFKTATNALIYFKKPGLFFICNAINFVATISISVAGLVHEPNSLYGPISGRFYSGVIIFLLSLYIFRKHAEPAFDKTFLPDLQKFCTPYLMYVLCYWVLTNIDRYFLKSAIDKDTLASYDIILKCFFGIEFLQNSLSAVIFPKVFDLWARHRKHETIPESNRYFNVFTVINLLIIMFFCIITPLVIQIFAPGKPGYFKSFAYIGIIGAGYATRSILNFYMSTILFSKSTLLLVKIFGYSALVQIAVTYTLVSHFGILGAVYSGIITKLIQVIFSYYFTRHIFSYHFNWMKIYGLPLLYIAVSIILFYTIPSYNLVIYGLVFLVFSGLFYLIFRNEIVALAQQFFARKR